jgi:peptide chain release factor
VVKSQATRSKSQNYTIARKLLAEKVELLEKGSESRAVKVVERKSKKKRSADKKKRRKYRALAGDKAGQGEDGGPVEEDEEGEHMGRDEADTDEVDVGHSEDTHLENGANLPRS